MTYFHLWVAGLQVVVEGWRHRLRCSDAAIDYLLDSGPADLLREFRDSAYHYDPEFERATLNYTGGEGFEWLQELTIAFAEYFVRERGTDSLLRSSGLVQISESAEALPNVALQLTNG